MTNMHTLLQDSINNIKNISTIQQAKPLIYLGLALIALACLIQRAIVESKQKSRVASRLPDPEKPTQTRPKAPERPDGGEC
jgi:hypothetical protein